VLRLLGDLDGIRTHGHLIKSQVLYRLSYEISASKAGANVHAFNLNMQVLVKKNTNKNLESRSWELVHIKYRLGFFTFVDPKQGFWTYLIDKLWKVSAKNRSVNCYAATSA
jgi:hypothetical protein